MEELIDDFWLKFLSELKRNRAENDKISTENVFVSCNLDEIQIGNGIQFCGSKNNFQKPKRLYRNHKQMSVEEVMSTKKVGLIVWCLIISIWLNEKLNLF